MTDAHGSKGDGDPHENEDENDDQNEDDVGDDALSTETVYEAMEPLEPYTTSELASVLEVPGRLARTLLDRLAVEGTIRKKEPEPKRTIWIREPPKHECPNCGGEFEVKYFHPVFQAVQFCPKCGTRLRRTGRD